MHPASYRLYGSEMSYYTGKVRAYLRWKNVPYEEINADASVYREVIVPRVGVPVIPVVVGPQDETLQDSTDIIDELERRHGEPAIYPATPLQRLVALLMELYGDEWLLIPAMHYRWRFNRDWAIWAFGAMSAPQATREQQVSIGKKISAPFEDAAARLGSEPHMHAAIETSYEGLLAELDAHFAAQPYLLGTRPSLGDFGLFGPLYAHQYRDPSSGELMRRLAPNVVRWVERMHQPDAPGSGEFLPRDEVPGALLPVLRRMMREQLPVLKDTARLLRAWLLAHPGTRIPRAIGMHEFELEGRRGRRIVRPYSLWMLQRVRDAYGAMTGTDRARADALLKAVGGELLIDLEDPPRLQRDGLTVAVC